ncbi:hypothetical protein OSJ10_20120 [Mycobacterium ulcerans]
MTADRMVKADSAIASKTVTLLANNDRLAVGSWITGAATAVIGIPPIQSSEFPQSSVGQR